MARMILKHGKVSRREGHHTHIKAVKITSKRNYGPGQHGQARKPKPSNFSLQLREKQKIKRIYGVLEKQFKSYAEKASKRAGVAGENLLIDLELRLDNVVFRTNLFRSRQQARQAVSHKHVLLNGKKVNIPSLKIKVGDKIVVSKNLEKIFESDSKKELVPWLSLAKDSYEVISLPTRNDIEPGIEEQLVIEYYSK